MASSDETTRPDHADAPLLATRLVVFWEGGELTRVIRPDETLTVGRHTDCDIVIDLPSVSRKHARITGGSPLLVEDLGGMNGVRVRGDRITPGERVRIFDGDTVELGGAVICVSAPFSRNRTRNSRPPPLDDPMQAVQHLVALVAASEIGVLLLGETGVGKTVIAKEIHARSNRARGPLLRLNCAAMPEALLESELFGYERGAFTGATQVKPGLFESASGGTVLLDEIGEMPLLTQAKLLSVLETREVMRLGSVKPRPIDVRFIAATHRDLLARSAEGLFRADLYYRLAGISIVIPPLRERRAEIEAFAMRFLADACARAKRPRAELSGEALSVLLRYSFPGNLRELRNTMDRACVLAEGGAVYPEHLLFEPTAPKSTPQRDFAPAAIRTPASTWAAHDTVAPPSSKEPKREAPAPLKNQVEAFERDRIVAALAECNGNQTRAAVKLGMSRRALVARIEQYGLPRPRKR